MARVVPLAGRHQRARVPKSLEEHPENKSCLMCRYSLAPHCCFGELVVPGVLKLPGLAPPVPKHRLQVLPPVYRHVRSVLRGLVPSHCPWV